MQQLFAKEREGTNTFFFDCTELSQKTTNRYTKTIVSSSLATRESCLNTLSFSLISATASQQMMEERTGHVLLRRLGPLPGEFSGDWIPM